MASNLTSDEVAEQNMVFQEDDDVFIAEEIGDSLGDQEVEQVMMLEPKKGLMFDSEDDVVRFYKGYAKKKGFGVKGSRKSKGGQESNPLSSQQTEELETSEPSTSIHIKSYIDILQGNKDVMDLLDANSNG
ncbi:protein FAR-RED IMPAIRED RESPONSE 1-like [Hordeum vulgare]|nr:protein FAR-RED IMPAIRED RESPONSE 1-like [Hordeum vulgare]